MNTWKTRLQNLTVSNHSLSLFLRDMTVVKRANCILRSHSHYEWYMFFYIKTMLVVLCSRSKDNLGVKLKRVFYYLFVYMSCIGTLSKTFVMVVNRKFCNIFVESSKILITYMTLLLCVTCLTVNELSVK